MASTTTPDATNRAAPDAEDWDRTRLETWGLGVGDPTPPPSKVVEAFLDDPPPEGERMIAPERLRRTWEERTGNSLNGSEPPGSNADEEEEPEPDQETEDAPERRPLEPGEKADPWDGPNRVIELGTWDRTHSRSVVPGGELSKVEPDSVALTWRSAALSRDSDLDHRERLVVCVLAEHMGACGSSAFPSQRTIAERAGMHRQTVVDRLERLRGKGWLGWIPCEKHNGMPASRLYVPGIPGGSGHVELSGADS